MVLCGYMVGMCVMLCTHTHTENHPKVSATTLIGTHLDRTCWGVGTSVAKTFGGIIYTGKVVEVFEEDQLWSVRYDDDGDKEDFNQLEMQLGVDL